MCTFVWLLGENQSMISICRTGISRHTGMIEMLMGAFKAVMGMYISYKFGELLSGTSAVDAAQLCIAGINQQ